MKKERLWLRVTMGMNPTHLVLSKESQTYEHALYGSIFTMLKTRQN